MKRSGRGNIYGCFTTITPGLVACKRFDEVRGEVVEVEMLHTGTTDSTLTPE